MNARLLGARLKKLYILTSSGMMFAFRKAARSQLYFLEVYSKYQVLI
jgi:hypothetical protein